MIVSRNTMITLNAFRLRCTPLNSAALHEAMTHCSLVSSLYVQLTHKEDSVCSRETLLLLVSLAVSRTFLKGGSQYFDRTRGVQDRRCDPIALSFYDNTRS
jgi:hypothetical protein